MLAIVYQILGYLPYVVSALIAALAVIAPITSSDLDNKVLAALRWFEDVVVSVLVKLIPAAAAKGASVDPAK